MNTPVKVFVHPLDRPGRQRQEQITQALSEFVAPAFGSAICSRRMSSFRPTWCVN